MKKRLWTGILLAVLAGAMVCTSGCSSNKSEESEDDSLVVFNYGDYIDDHVVELFEEETGIHVKYEEYVTPEDMFTKYQSGAIHYDLICTSEYMIEKMILSGEAQKVDTSSMKYYDNLDPTYLEFCQAFDPQNEYAVPYFWGTVGILYNTEMVEEEVESWEILWDEKYRDLLVMQNSMRDAFMVPLKFTGKSLNTIDLEELKEAQQMLFDQKELIMAYLVDETRDIMIAGDAAMAVIYSGDASAAIDSNEKLAYCVPKEGSNIWLDCWMIPKTARHKEAAEKFIDFMNREDIAAMNFDYVCYPTPNQAVYESLDPELKEDTTVFPPEEILKKCEVYQYLGTDMERTYNQLWKELKSY